MRDSAGSRASASVAVDDEEEGASEAPLLSVVKTAAALDEEAVGEEEE
jgi:hypothetical protein